MTRAKSPVCERRRQAKHAKFGEIGRYFWLLTDFCANRKVEWPGRACGLRSRLNHYGARPRRHSRLRGNDGR